MVNSIQPPANGRGRRRSRDLALDNLDAPMGHRGGTDRSTELVVRRWGCSKLPKHEMLVPA
jgi:hypothetical protein